MEPEWAQVGFIECENSIVLIVNNNPSFLPGREQAVRLSYFIQTHPALGVVAQIGGDGASMLNGKRVRIFQNFDPAEFGKCPAQLDYIETMLLQACRLPQFEILKGM